VDINKEDIAIVLASLDSSIQKMFPVTDDTEGAFNKMLDHLPEKYRNGLAIDYMGLQNAIMVKHAKNIRTQLKLDINDELFRPDSQEALLLAQAQWVADDITPADIDEEIEKVSEGSGNPYANIEED